MRATILVVKTGHACRAGRARYSLCLANGHAVSVEGLPGGLAASCVVGYGLLRGARRCLHHVLLLHEVIR